MKLKLRDILYKKIAIITSSKVPNLLNYDRELIELMRKEGLKPEVIIWDEDNYDIGKYDVILMRTAWDYYLKPQQFREFLEKLKESNKLVLNPLEIMIPNMHKFYLKDLINEGIKVIPTIFRDKLSCFPDSEFKEIIGESKFIVKPVISAGSHNTKLFEKYDYLAKQFIKELNTQNDIMIQKYIPEIETIGEFSNIFFSNGYSYTVNKKPKEGDYRIQKDYGGVYTQVTPPEIVRETAQVIADLFLSKALYVRVDGIFTDNKFLLMEVEMLEPDLYMDIVPEAKPQFINALLSKFSN